MKSRIKQISTLLAAIMVAGSMSVIAQTADEAAALKAAQKKDKTGTNPMNFTYDARIYNEYRDLNTAGDGDQNITTFEFRAPILDGKFQVRAKLRNVSLNADLDGDGTDDVDDSGMGDTDLRIMTVTGVNMKKRIAFAPGLEVTLDTASEDSLGAGATTFAPFLFGAYFNPLGKGSIFVPGYQHFFSVDEEDGRDQVNYGLIDLFLVKTFNANQFWAYIDPQIILDYEQDMEYMLLEIQVGTMLDKYLGTKGHSTYILPSFGVGDDRPYDVSVEAGYKIVW
jgi:hypothetical protein